LGIRVIARLYIFNPGDELLKIAENNARRDAFVKTVVDAVQLLQLEGLYFFWEWPACSPVQSQIDF
jgi:GH18 family chitinase